RAAFGVAERRRQRVGGPLAGGQVQPVARAEGRPVLPGQVLAQPLRGLLGVGEDAGGPQRGVEVPQCRVQETRWAGERNRQVRLYGANQTKYRAEFPDSFVQFNLRSYVRRIRIANRV